jgi:4-hydroxybenzoate polyprenyltransferase
MTEPTSPETDTTSASDIASGDWIDRRVPAWFRPYCRLARLDRPIGVWLLVIPCWWGLALAVVSINGASLLEAVGLAPLFWLGAFLMRGAGCAWNDILDRDIDAKVARTATRPIASGALSVVQAATFMALLALAAAAILLALNRFTQILAVSSLALVALYPLMKRITYWPQAFLGLTFNWGALVGYAAIVERIDPSALALYIGAFFWTLGYDTIYAHQDKEDDALVGVKSTALKFGANSKPWIAGFYLAAMACFAAAGFLAAFSPFYYVVLAWPAYSLWSQVRDADLDDPKDCLARFKSNTGVGFTLLLALFLGYRF